MANAAWELRVHGVAGTPTAAMLELGAEPVAGAWGGSEHKDLDLCKMPEHAAHRRALSWSSLTSGKAIHAFYVLLLPFMLCNVAGWTLPGVGEGRSGPLRRRLFLARLVAFLVTLQFATLLTLTGVDIVGRQTALGSWAQGPNDPWDPWLAAASVVLCGLIAVGLAWLTHVRPLKKEPDADGDTPSRPSPQGGHERDRNPLLDPAGAASLTRNQEALWTTPATARLLHHAHVGLLLGAVALLVGGSALVSCVGDAAMAFFSCPGAHPLADEAMIALLVTGGVGALAGPLVVLGLSLTTSGRFVRWLPREVRGSQWLAGVALAVAAWVWAGSPAAVDDAVMPGVRGALVGTMLLLLVVLAVLLLVKGWRAGALVMLAAGVGALYGAGAGTTVHTVLRSPGMIPASFGWLAAAFIVAAVILMSLGSFRYIKLYRQDPRAANAPMVALRKLVDAPQRVVAVIGSVGAICAGALLIGFAIYAVRNLEPGVDLLQQMPELPPVDAVPAAVPLAWTLVALLVAFAARTVAVVAGGILRVIGVAAVTVAIMAVALEWFQWAAPAAGRGGRAWFTTALPWQLVSAGVAGAVIVGVACAIAWRLRRGTGLAVVLASLVGVAALAWMLATTPTAEDVLVTTALTLPVGLVITRLRGGFRDREARKGLAVLWDVGTFWPRWFHPFSPPTYSDTAVYGLSQLLQKQLPDQPILLAPHSQGSVIAVAAILHAKQAMGDKAPSPLDRLAMLTYGSPVTRLYGKMFPSMFSTAAVSEVADALQTDGKVRWRNLWRQSDPIGGSIAIGRGIDDPSTADGLPDPAKRAHSAYWDEEVWDEAVKELVPAIETDRNAMGDSSHALVPRRFPSTEGTVWHDVLEAGAGPSVVLLHEVMGVTPSVRALAYRLMACGFRVHVPVLFGRSDGTARGVVGGLWCLRRELSAFAAGEATPLSAWVRALVRDIGNDRDSKVGVIGMCMTGGLAIAALAEPQTGAAVAAQPSLPITGIVHKPAAGDLGVSKKTLGAAVASGTPLLAARYEKDWMCPRERMQRIRSEFGVAQPAVETLSDGVIVESHGRLTVITVPGRGHSVFTGDANEPALQRLVEFLRENLMAQRGGAAASESTKPDGTDA